MSSSSAPDAVLNLLSCRPTCKRICKLPQCQCFENRLKCTSACTLQNCIDVYKNEDETHSAPFRMMTQIMINYNSVSPRIKVHALIFEDALSFQK